MQSKKEPVLKAEAARHKSARPKNVRPVPLIILGGQSSKTNGTHYEQPVIRNPEMAEAREKRLAKREALTLRAFKIAYDNHHNRKSS
jgi:hypothetical protein